MLRWSAIIALLLVGNSKLALAADDSITPAGIEYFEKHIRPVLVEKCYQCHSASSKKLKGGLLLDTREGTRRGGDSGAAVVPKSIDDSSLMEAIRYEGLEMPPDERLPEQTIAKFEAWIQMGAPDPRDGKSAPIQQTIDIEKGREFWAFQPRAQVESPELPSIWGRNSIDGFLWRTWQQRGLEPVEPARPEQLIRRLYFDLTGLPPSPEQIDEFCADPSEERYQKTIERLLDSESFGQRWGRHWLDVARYAESTGMERNFTYPHAWKYRDFVIHALNSDMPYDQFLREQVAGDLLQDDDAEQNKRRLIATGFLTLGPKSLNETNREQFAMDVVDEQLDVTARAFNGLTAACARCHDHKFDPIPQSDYYAMAGIFRSTETFFGTGKQNGNRNAGRILRWDGKSGTPIAVAGGNNNANAKAKNANTQRLRSARARLKKLEAQAAKQPPESAAGKRLKKQITAAETQVKRFQQAAKKQQVAAPKDKAPNDKAPNDKAPNDKAPNDKAPNDKAPNDKAPNRISELLMAVGDAKSPGDTELRIRGEPNDLGPKVPRGFLSVVHLSSVPKLDEGSGRLALADWLASKDHPLTARVAVNRIWQHLLGEGIVATVDNFGANGARPTHPQLLDWLANDFVENGWSVKQTIRQIVSSETYRLGAIDHPKNLKIDPANALIWRARHRRLEAEAIRDSMLKITGDLVEGAPKVGSIVAKVGDGNVGRGLSATDFDSANLHRSVYLPIVRGVVPEMLQVFDFPEPSNISGRREVTTVSTQALFLMNSPFAIDQAEKLADQVLKSSDDDNQRIDRAFRLTLGRRPTDTERTAARQFLTEMSEPAGESGTTPKGERSSPTLTAWSLLAQSLFASAEFRYLE